MWLAMNVGGVEQLKKEEICDRLLALSPEIAEGPDNALLVPLARVSAYWNLNELQAATYTEPSGHAFLEKLAELHKDFNLHFTLTPTAPWALWTLAMSKGDRLTRPLLELWDASACKQAITQSAPTLASTLLPDLLKSSDARSVFEYLVESCDELGITQIERLLHIPPESLSQRFGPLALRLLKRVHGTDDLTVDWYEPPISLTRTFNPKFDKMVSSEDDNEDLLGKFSGTLVAWEKRLAARRSVLKGLRLRVRSELRQKQEAIFVSLPRASRNARQLFEILKEKWMTLTQKGGGAGESFFEDDIDELILESLGIEPDVDAQLDLFDPHREERSEAWNTLIGKLIAKSTPKEPVRIGTWRPVESYLPERACEWVDWNEQSRVAMIQDHPRRPTTLLKEPCPLTSPVLTSERDFLAYLIENNGLTSLEKIVDPWETKTRSPDRSYARIRNLWVFWDHTRSRAFIHGYFEATQLQL